MFHAIEMREYGTQVVGGVTPGRGGTEKEGFQVFDSVQEAVEQTQANTTCIFVPAPFGADAIFEAIDSGLGLIVVITEGIPAIEMVKIKRVLGAVSAGWSPNSLQTFPSPVHNQICESSGLPRLFTLHPIPGCLLFTPFRTHSCPTYSLKYVYRGQCFLDVGNLLTLLS